jgi:membrane protease YdiL (CAAX protease family)
VTPDQVRGATFGRAVWNGYGRSNVQSLLERAAVQVEAGQSPRKLVEAAHLGAERWGYSRVQVDRFLGDLAHSDTAPQPGASMGSWAGLARGIALRAVLVLGLAAVIGALAGPAASATVLAVFVVAVQPFYGRRRFLRFVRAVRSQPDIRIRYYVGGMAGSWIYVGAVAVIGALAGRHPADIGLTDRARNSYEAAQGVADVTSAAFALAISTSVLWLAGPKLVGRVRRMLLPLSEFLPGRAGERLTFAGVAVTAGICEEILYRGFGIAYLRWLDPGIGRTAVIAITAAAFGLAHLYQGPRNVLLTGLAGAILAALTVATGSLLPAIVIHSLIDLRVCFLPPRLIRPRADERRRPALNDAISGGLG